ncbi:hypothetical protein BYT27DRAFT_7194503 [Phlegmacium glaucopus]|nr:hypothetical protein BYT27DRAFT_7194503 [Phlegmacium glaucopus]
MSELQKDLYSASCNPPRRAKRISIVESSQLSHDRATLPMPSTMPAVSSITTDAIPAPPAAAPAKRGRKPGPLSRSAREAQRRLNHSIIEKARRTKINDALATLRQLVPVDYGSTQPQNEPHEEEDDDDDDEYPEEGAKRTKPKPKPKGTGKREEKEKEFKLEILVRTVSFLQDLLQRVDAMENSLPVCKHCGEATEPCKKRKHSQVYDEDDNDYRNPKIPRNAETSSKVLNSPVPTTEPQTTGNRSQARLPSISSWLPNVVIDPSLLPPQNKPERSVSPSSAYLPSPPSSTHFDPIRTSQVPPVLNLGPVATAAMVTLPRTSEDESAASLLLQIATSPPFRPSLATSSTNSSYNLPDPSKFLLHSDVRHQRLGQVRQPQTPGSLLGLYQEQKY